MANNQDLREYDFPYLDVGRGVERTLKVVTGYHWTDAGNAERLLHYYGPIIRHSLQLTSWFEWDKLRWAPDETGRIYELAKDTVRCIHAEASLIQGENQKDTRRLRKAVTSHAYRSESMTRLDAMIRYASTDACVSLPASAFNANPWLLNCANGTLDLEARELREHRREDLITKIAAVPYDPDAKCDEWNTALKDALPTTKEAAFLQRAAGSALTGINRDKMLFLLYGKPNARKSTILDSIFKVYGDYALPVDVATFSKNINRPGGTRADIISLDGIRAAQCSEVPRGMIFNEAFVKAMTGANPRSARDLYERSMRRVEPITKFFIETNFIPKMPFDDDAAFNRFGIIKFLNTIDLDKCDPSKKQFLLTDQDAQKAILAWIVQGCYDWQDSGLAPPDSVNAARKEYQASMNPLAEFFNDQVVIEPGAAVSTAELFQRFKDVASRDAYLEAPSIISFGAHLTRLGYPSKTMRDTSGNLIKGRVGIRLRGLGDD